MSIYRIKKDSENPYVMVHKEMLNDIELSMRAKGLLVYMLSMPDDWEFYDTELVNHFPEGIKAIRSTIKELVSLGYIIKGEQKRTGGGRFSSYEYHVYEKSNRMPQRADRQRVDRQRHTTNNNLTNNDLNNIIQHYSSVGYLNDSLIQDIVNEYCLLRFEIPLRNTTKSHDLDVLCYFEVDDLVEFLEEHIQTYDQCNLDYLEKIQGRAK